MLRLRGFMEVEIERLILFRRFVVNKIRGRSPTEYIIMRNFLLIFVEIRTIIRRESIELIFFRKIYRGKARKCE